MQNKLFVFFVCFCFFPLFHNDKVNFQVNIHRIIQMGDECVPLNYHVIFPIQLFALLIFSIVICFEINTIFIVLEGESVMDFVFSK